MIDVYIITNVANGKEYVGITSRGYLTRFKSHISTSKKLNDKRSRYVLYNAMRKHGVNSFKVELLEQVDTYEEAKIKEKEYINKFNTYYKNNLNWGYNMTLGGDGIGTFKMTQKQKNKLRDISKKQFQDNEFLVKFKKIMQSDEVRQKISKANSGEKNGMYGKGHLISGKHNYWYGKKGELHCNYGRKYSEESKEKLRRATINTWRNDELREKYIKHIKELGKKQTGLNNPSSKKTYVYNKDYSLVFIGTSKDVGKFIGCCQSTLRKYKDKNNLVNGYYIKTRELNGILNEE